MRADIQALRAVAVAIVVAYHLWPTRLPGGFIGVDVFFVISGFLITAHLVRETDNTGRLSLPAFWARRARRLLPASLLVLASTALATAVFVPRAYWGQFFEEIIAATLYVENWFLAAASTDYLDAENLASPVQHFWSLSVEEQFYVAWPLLIVAALGVGRMRRIHPRVVITAFVGAIVVLGLAYSVWITFENQPLAYFVTPARAWEFAAGGLLALTGSRSSTWPHALRAALAWAGWILIAATALILTGDVPFPGVAALLPVAGTLAVIAADEPRARWASTALVSWAPVQRLGDISYSLYLWHWPLVTIVPFALAQPLTTPVKLAVLAASLLLAAATYTLVENPARKTRRFGLARPRGVAAWVIAVMLVVCLAAGSGIAVARSTPVGIDSAAEGEAASGAGCLGAAAFANPEECASRDSTGPVVPDLSTIFDDTAGAYSCYDYEPLDTELTTCSLGPEAAAARIAIIGDSHAAMLVPGLRMQLDEREWRLDTYVSRGCIWRAPNPAVAKDECAPMRRAMQQVLEMGEPYDAVILAGRRNPGISDAEAKVEADLYAEAWSPVAERGTRIIVVADNPLVTQEAFDCVLTAGSAGEAELCTVDQTTALAAPDALSIAAKSSDDAARINLTQLYCLDGRCPLVVGGMMVYRDLHHISASYSITIAPFLADEIDAILGR